MNKQEILELAKQDPRFSKAVLMIEEKIQDMPVTAEGLGELVKMLEMALNNPDKYPEIRAAAIADGMAQEEDLPQEFDQVLLISLLVALYGLQERQKTAFAKGGLARAASQLRQRGRNGDTILAHINPREAAMLQAHGGSGRINPQTGLPEFGFFSDLLKIAVPIVATFLAPGVGTWLASTAMGAAVGLGGVGATIAGGALTGAIGAGLTGGDVGKGALGGALGGGLGGWVGEQAAGAMGGWGAGLGEAGKAALGGGIVGGVAGAANGQGFLQGAAQGAAGAWLGNQVQGMGGEGSVGAGVNQAGNTFGNMMTAGYTPGQSLAGAGLSGVMAGVANNMRPSDAVLKGFKSNDNTFKTQEPGLGSGQFANANDPTQLQFATNGEMNPTQGGTNPLTYNSPQPTTSMGNMPKEGGLSSLLNSKNLMMGASLLGSLGGAPAEAQAAVAQLSPQQKELFNRPSVTWDWQRMQNDANQSGMGLSQYMAQNWPKITGYAQGGDPRQGQYAQTTPSTAPGYAMGGLSRFAQGGGSGRADTIDAKLSDGEYVMDAETVALLGDGSPEEGAQRLDQMRAAIRSHKGKALSRGKISPDAKSPLAYLKG